MKRFLIVEGIKGALVADPVNNDPSRFVGQILKPHEERLALPNRVDHYTPIVVVVEQCSHLLKAIGNGTLKKLAGPILADDHGAAFAIYNKKPVVTPAKDK